MTDGACHHRRDDVRRPRGVVEARPGRRRQRPVRREVRHVVLPGTEEHLDHVGDALVDVVLDEVEPVAHGQQMAQRDGVPRVVGRRPFRHAGRDVEVEQSVTDQQADHGVQHGLGHRPAEQSASAASPGRAAGRSRPADPGSARPRWRRHGRPRRRGFWRGGPPSSHTASSSRPRASATAAGGSARDHAAVGHGTPSGCAGSGTRAGSAGLTESGSPKQAHRVSCPHARRGWRRAGPRAQPPRRTALD